MIYRIHSRVTGKPSGTDYETAAQAFRNIHGYAAKRANRLRSGIIKSAVVMEWDDSLQPIRSVREVTYEELFAPMEGEGPPLARLGLDECEPKEVIRRLEGALALYVAAHQRLTRTVWNYAKRNCDEELKKAILNSYYAPMEKAE